MIATSIYCYEMMQNTLVKSLETSKINLFFNDVTPTTSSELCDFKMEKALEKPLTPKWEMTVLEDGICITHPKIVWDNSLRAVVADGAIIYGYCVYLNDQLLFSERFGSQERVKGLTTVMISPKYVLHQYPETSKATETNDENRKNMISKMVFILCIVVIIALLLLGIYLCG